MIGCGALFTRDMFFGKWWYTNILTKSCIEVYPKFTIIKLIAESTLNSIIDTGSKIFGNSIVNMEVVT